MAEYIEREALKNDIAKNTEPFNTGSVFRAINRQIAADVAPVVRCKDCKHSWEDIGGLCCSHGVCVDLTVPGDFYCAYGERKS